jgi:general secretion pathway protein L
MKLSPAAPGPLWALAEFATWWSAQMRSLIPAAQRRGEGGQDALLIAIDRPLTNGASNEPLSATLWLRQRGQTTAFGSLASNGPSPAIPNHLKTGLKLPPGCVLTRQVALPLAAARQLHTVMRFEMDRLTPFAPDELYWGISGVTPDRAHGKLRLQLAFVLRDPVDRLCQALARQLLFPGFIEAPGGRIALQADAPRRRWLTAALPLLCGLLALACLATPLLRQQMAMTKATNTIAAQAPAAQTALALRQQLSTAAFGRIAIAQAQQEGDALHVLAQLTDALPDGTWLDDLTLKSGTVNLDGQSANAAALIGRLSAAPGLRDPSFTAPVTRTADGKSDQFSLQASITQ